MSVNAPYVVNSLVKDWYKHQKDLSLCESKSEDLDFFTKRQALGNIPSTKERIKQIEEVLNLLDHKKLGELLGTNKDN